MGFGHTPNGFDNIVRNEARLAALQDFGAGKEPRWGGPRDRQRPRSKTAIVLTVLLAVAVLLYGNFWLGMYLGSPLLTLGTEETEMDGYTLTMTRSIGFNVHHLHGSSVDCKMFKLWGGEAEPPVILEERALEQLMESVTAQRGGNLKEYPAYDFLEMGTFAGIHVYHVSPVDRYEESYEIIAQVAMADYAVYDGQVYMMEESAETFPAILRGRMEDGSLTCYNLWMPTEYDLGYDSVAFKEAFPEGVKIYLEDEDGTDARAKRDAAAAAALGGEVSVDRIEVSGEGRMTVYRPDLESYNPLISSELEYHVVQERKLKPRTEQEKN